MTCNSVMGFISSLALFLPIFFIIALRIGSYNSFPALLVYYIFVLFYNLFTEGYIKVNPDFKHYWGLSNNLLDAPLMLMFLTYFSPSLSLTRRMKYMILLFIIFEAVVILLRGFNIGALTIILGPGLLIVFSFCLYFFIRQSRIAVTHRKALGKSLMVSSLLFAYGCFTIIYLLYYVFKTNHVADTFLIYFLVTTFSSILMCTGIIIERKRVQKLNELKLTRKELSHIYKETKTTPPFKTVILDFDKEQWN